MIRTDDRTQTVAVHGAEEIPMPSNVALATVEPVTTLVRPANDTSMVRFTREKIELIKRTICEGASDDELELFILQCQRTGLDPFSRQIYSITRREKNAEGDYVNKRTMQVSIDGFRLIAERSGKYRGQTSPEWCGQDGVWQTVWLAPVPPAAARVGVLRADFDAPTYAVARWDAYAQTFSKRGGEPQLTHMWSKMGDVMLAKCAEALALRKAFPNELGGLYTSDEMMQAATVQVADDTDARAPRSRSAPPNESMGPERPPRNQWPESLAPFRQAVKELEIPGEAVGVWRSHREVIKAEGAKVRRAAWWLLVNTLKAQGVDDAANWLTTAIGEADKRASDDAARASSPPASPVTADRPVARGPSSAVARVAAMHAEQLAAKQTPAPAPVATPAADTHVVRDAPPAPAEAHPVLARFETAVRDLERDALETDAPRLWIRYRDALIEAGGRWKATAWVALCVHVAKLSKRDAADVETWLQQLVAETDARDGTAPSAEPSAGDPVLAVFAREVSAIELPGEAVTLWLRHAPVISRTAIPVQQAAWKLLCARVGTIGGIPKPHAWLKRAIAEEQARRSTGGAA